MLEEVMESGGSPAVGARKAALTPKAILHQRFGAKACYTVEEVQECAQNECPGLAIVQKGPCLFRCRLELPEFSVISATFKKKRDAEQSAAELALEKLGIDPTADNHIHEDPWDALVGRVKYLFSDEFFASHHPVSSHLRASLQREGNHNGCVPVSAIALLDAKLSNLSKLIDPKVELNPYLVMNYILKAASQLSEILVTSEEQLWIKRQNQWPIDSAVEQTSSTDSIIIEAVYIPCSRSEDISVVYLNVSSRYYLDVIAEQLGLSDASKLFITRSIGKASSETRLYFPASESYLSDQTLDITHCTTEICSDGLFNTRASYLASENIFGDAIFASVGYTWKSKDLSHERVNIQLYYRMLMNRVPSGIYKRSRGAILMADLPLAYTSKTNWRGSLPRDILCMFCRQHRLMEPTFSVMSISEALTEQSGSQKKLKVMDSGGEEAHCGNGPSAAAADVREAEPGGNFKCEVKIFSKSHGLLIECVPTQSYKKQSDAVQNAALQALVLFDWHFKDVNLSGKKIESSTTELVVKFYPQNYMKTFSLCYSYNGGKHYDSNTLSECETPSVDIKGPDSGVSPINGSLVTITYTVMLVNGSESLQELVESNEDFEFEFGTGSIFSPLEVAVAQMTVGQTGSLFIDMPIKEIILAAGDNSERIHQFLSMDDCRIKYTITLVRITEPMEDRMEKALFSPPLSKQRVGYALQHIKQSSATNLVDFGCGSGSLLESLLNYETSLEHVVGIDISRKSLVRAAKVLNSKLSTNKGIKSATLYDGSITDFDPRLRGFDIGTCLEVIEHMEEDDAWAFGKIVLSYFSPKILIVSTPNYEYNAVLQKSLTGQDEDHTQSCKFRNHDHKFEWTREQFNHWAKDLATKNNYSVEFSGVGGSGDMEPGFASQIAVFKRGNCFDLDIASQEDNSARSKHKYNVVWEWNCSVTNFTEVVLA